MLKKSQLVQAADFSYVATGFRDLLPVGANVEQHLRAVLEETLSHAGSLLRAQMIFAAASRAGVERAVARTLAVAVEYFHSASLLFDDLPAMDDAVQRRGFTCPHLVHGEAAAMLGALALINQGYALLWQVLGTLPPAVAAEASSLVNECLGLAGILNGQARDLRFERGAGEAEVLRVAEGKTVTLIRLTLLLPAIVAQASPETRARLEELARCWGFAYQIADDFKDLLMHDAETGKSSQRDAALGRPNLPATVGCREAFTRLSQFLERGQELVEALAVEQDLPELRRLQAILDQERQTIGARLRERQRSTTDGISPERLARERSALDRICA